MRDNNITESEYVGWGLWPEKKNSIGEILELTGWENVHDITGENNDFRYVPKKIAFKILQNTVCRFRSDSPIICARSVDRQQIFSEV